MVEESKWKEWVGLPKSRLREKTQIAAITKNTPDLCDLTEAWLRTKGKVGPNISQSTIKSCRISINLLVKHWDETDPQPLLNPDPQAGQRWLQSLEERHYQPGTVSSKRSGVRHLYAALRCAEATTADPFGDARVTADKVPPWEKRQPYTEGEINKLLEVATNPYDRVLVLLGAHAGLRASECCQLKWKDVDLEQPRLTVWHGKGGTTRTLPFGRTLTDALRGARPLIADDRFVLPYRTPANAWRRMKELCLRAGVAQKGVHSLRHSAGTRMYKQTHDAQTTAHHLGHKRLDGIQTYAKWSDEVLREAIADW